MTNTNPYCFMLYHYVWSHKELFEAITVHNPFPAGTRRWNNVEI